MKAGVVRALVLVVAVCSVLSVAGRASAHAELVAVDPPNGAVVDAAPAQVVLTFNEAVSLTGGSAAVLDAAAGTVSAAPRLDGHAVVIPLPGELPDGTYTVSFEVISADSHRIGGATVFHVGAPSPGVVTPPVVPGDDAEWWVSALAIGAGFVAYAAVLGAVGLWWFTLLTGVRADVVRGMATRAAVVGIAVLLAGLPVRIAHAAGGLDALADDAVLSDGLRGPIGVSSAVGVAALVVFLAAALAPRAGDDRRRTVTATTATVTVTTVLAAVASVAALAGFAVEGHTRSQHPRAAIVAFDLVHLAAGAVWLGGIAGLVLAFRARIEPGALGVAVGRFSTAAVWAVLAVSAAGVGMAWIVLPSFGALADTGYGWSLIVKVALVAVVVALGAYNRRVLVRPVRGEGAPAERARHRLAVTVLAELAVLLAVVGVTAVLVTRSPVPAVVAAPVPSGVAAVELSDGAGTATVRFDPATTGANRLRVELVDAGGGPLVPVEPPDVTLSEAASGVGPLRPAGALAPVADGVYETTIDVPLAGDWTVAVRVRTGEFDSVAGDAVVALGAATAPAGDHQHGH